MTEQVFVASARFDALVAALSSLDKDHPQFENYIISALVEIGGVLPNTIQAETEAYEAGYAAAQAGNPAVGDDPDFLRGHADGAGILARCVKAGQDAILSELGKLAA